LTILNEKVKNKNEKRNFKFKNFELQFFTFHF